MSVSCAAGYSGTAQVAPCTVSGDYTLSGCTALQDCNAGNAAGVGSCTGTAGYTNSESATDVHCAGNPCVSGDFADGGPCCAVITCTQPPDITGYTVVEANLVLSSAFDVTATCGGGYEGSPTVQACTTSGAYTLTGCSAVPDTSKKRGAASPAEITSFKISVMTVQLCRTDDFKQCEFLYKSASCTGRDNMAEWWATATDPEQLSVEGRLPPPTNCKEPGLWDVIARIAQRMRHPYPKRPGGIPDHGDLAAAWFDTFPAADWLDLMDPASTSPALATEVPIGTYRSGKITFRPIGLIRGSVQLDASTTIYTKASVIDFHQYQDGIDYFPTTTAEDMTQAPAQDMRFLIKHPVRAFVFGRPLEVTEATNPFSLRLGYSVDRIITGYLNFHRDIMCGDHTFCIHRDEDDGTGRTYDMIDTPRHGPTIFGLSPSANAGMNVVVPPITGLAYKQSHRLFSKTYMVELPATRRHSPQEMGGVDPWYLRVEIFYTQHVMLHSAWVRWVRYHARGEPTRASKGAGG